MTYNQRNVECLYLKCEECGDITKVVFLTSDKDSSYTKGKIIE